MSSPLDNIPGAVPPPGQTSNFDAPSPLLVSTYTLNVVLVVLMLSIVSIRFYVRGKLLHSLGIDDYACLVAAIASLVGSVLILNSFRYGFGKHLWNIRVTDLLNTSNLRTSGAPQIVYPIANYAIKLSVLLLYKRVFSISKNLRLAVTITIIVLTILYIAYVGSGIAAVVQCVDLQSLSSDFACINMHDILLAQGIVNVVTDVFILVLPFRAVQNLQISRRQKLGVMAIFGAGLLTCIMSIVRCIYISLTYKMEDNLYDGALSSHFTCVEINMAIIASCAPALPAFVKQVQQVSNRIYRSLLHKTSTRSGWSKSGNEPPTSGQVDTYNEDFKSFSKSAYPSVTTTFELHRKPSSGREKLGRNSAMFSADESGHEGILKTVSVHHDRQSRF